MLETSSFCLESQLTIPVSFLSFPPSSAPEFVPKSQSQSIDYTEPGKFQSGLDVVAVNTNRTTTALIQVLLGCCRECKSVQWTHFFSDTWLIYQVYSQVVLIGKNRQFRIWQLQHQSSALQFPVKAMHWTQQPLSRYIWLPECLLEFRLISSKISIIRLHRNLAAHLSSHYLQRWLPISCFPCVLSKWC